LQQKDGSLAAAIAFSTLTGVSEIGVADWEGRDEATIFLLSTDERAIGVTRYDEQGKIAFPTLLPVEGRPLAMALGVPTKGATPSLAVILDQEGRRVLSVHTSGNLRRTQELAESFKSNPSSMRWHDVNQDGLLDLVVLIP
jgi:hypothetical protein